MDNKPQRTIHTMAAFLLIAVILCGLGVIYLFRTGISEALGAAKLIPTPEPYTELYFDHADSLPTSTVAGQPVAFSFTIHNVEGTSTVYPYVVSFQYPNGTSLVLLQNSVTLPDGASTTIDVSHIFRTSDVKGKVIVNLTSLNQEIDFLLPDANLSTN